MLVEDKLNNLLKIFTLLNIVGGKSSQVGPVFLLLKDRTWMWIPLASDVDPDSFGSVNPDPEV